MQIADNKQSIWFASEPIDFRKSIDGLCEIVQEQFDMLPYEAIFVFYNRARNRIKLLLWHHNGFMLIYKRFEKGRIYLKETDDEKILLKPDQLNWLLMGVDWVVLSEENNCQHSEFLEKKRAVNVDS